MNVVFEILQWLALLALFASRSVVKRELEDLRASLRGTDRMVQDLNEESMAKLLNECLYCVQPHLWYEREQLDGGAWVHYNGDGKIVFCGRQGSASSDGLEQGD
jgi:hypothetical protein